MTATPSELDAILTPARIATMRARVLDEVSSEIVRRTYNRRLTVIGAVAAAVLVVAAAITGTALVRSDDATGSQAVDRSISELAAPAVRSPSGGLTESGGQAIEQERAVITTGTITITSGDPHGSATQLAGWVESIGGRVDSWSQSSDDGETASLTIRVPSDQVTATTERLSTYGAVDTIELSHSDVTATVQDLDARINALQTSVDRLTEIMREADTSSTLIEAESALTQRQEQLESLLTQRSATADQVALATLTVRVQPDDVADDRDGLADALSDGWGSVTAVVSGVVLALAAALPWLGIAVVLLGGYWLLRRVRRSRRNSTPPASE
jgi:glycine cleavage system regulatory protein